MANSEGADRTSIWPSEFAVFSMGRADVSSVAREIQFGEGTLMQAESTLQSEQYVHRLPTRLGRKPRLVCVVTVSMSVKLFEGQLQYLAERGYDVTMVSSPGHELDSVGADGIATRAIPMEREISPFRDLRSLWALWRLFRKLRPDVVNVGTPKAGLLGTLAARMAGVPCVVYTLRGLRLETTSGWKRRVLVLTEGIACRLTHKVHCVSHSLQRNAIKLGIVDDGKAYVVAKGTSNGINVQRYIPSNMRSIDSGDLRSKLGIPVGSLVLGFVGRFTRDKGVEEMYRAFTSLKTDFPELKLLMVGDFESGDPVPASLRSSIESDPDILRTGFVADVAPYYSVMDVLVFPSHREGFPRVPLEAQAAGVPAVVSDATGAVESVVDGVTGLIVPVGDVDRLQDAVRRLLDDAELRRQMGGAGKGWVARNFAREVVWNALLADYQSLVEMFVTNKQRAGFRSIAAFYRSFGKRSLDVACASLAVILISPILLIVAALVRLRLGSPVFFRQVRPGRDTRPFTLIKFRTMNDARNAEGELLPDGERLTSLGEFLRRTSIDELPEFFNVLKGDMSMVGPRPLLVRYLPYYSHEERVRFSVRPGITGLAQVSGRNDLSWDDRLRRDVEYVKSLSFSNDVRILGDTVLCVLRRKGYQRDPNGIMLDLDAERKLRLNAQE